VNAIQEAAASKFEGDDGDCEWETAPATRDVAVAESQAKGAGHTAEDAARVY
jgi:hypothetical protein